MMNSIEFALDEMLWSKIITPLLIITAIVVVITVVSAILSAKHIRKGRDSVDKRASDDDAPMSSDDGCD